jgi:gamma-glutamyltranspeptidase/glutathione hydrolase
MKRGSIGKEGVVSTAHPLATKAGLSVLKEGGNAVDAAIASALTLGVVAPAWSGLGGGGFALIHLSRSDETVALDYREVAPMKSHAGMFEVDEAGNVKHNANAVGPLSVAVSGALNGIATMLEKYASLELHDICKFARDRAARGTPTSPTLRFIIKSNRDECVDKLARFEPAGSVFLQKTSPLKIRSRFLIPNLASTLDSMVREGAQDFYHESFADEIVTHLEKNGGILTREDFGRYTSKIRKTVTGTYRDFEICGMPPPSSGGLAIVEILNIIEGFDLSSMGHGNSQAIDLIAKAMRLAFKDRADYIADPDFVDVPASKLGSKQHANQLRSIMDADGPVLQPDPGAGFTNDGGSTTHLSVMDREGNVVAMTESIECYFGSGVLVPRLGVLMNDEMHDFDATPGNVNSIAPGKRPRSSMSPTIVFKGGEPRVVLGSAGGLRIVSSVLQTIINIIDFGMTLEQAVATPRFHVEGDKIILEETVGSRAQNALKRLGHKIEIKSSGDLFFGGVQAIAFEPSKNVFRGTADPRRDGAALAF